MHTILLAEDTKTTIDFVNTVLVENGYKLVIATNGLQAIRIAQKIIPSLILMDIQMPELNGYEACKILKNSEETREIPIIFLSALSKTFDKVKAFKLGAIDYVTKPIEAEELLIRIQTHLTTHSLKKQLLETNEKLESLVEERTKELSESNIKLSETIKELSAKTQALEFSQERYKYIAQSVTDYIYKVTLDNGKVIDIKHNNECFEVIGYRAEEFYEHKELWYEIIYKEDRKSFTKFLNDFLYTKNVSKYEHRMIHKNGNLIWVICTLLPFLNEKGELIEYNGIIRNISERKYLEQKVLNSIIETEEKERQRFAQDLHDGTGPLLSAAKMYLQWSLQSTNHEEIRNLIKKAESLINEAHNTSREISHNLSPHILQNFGLLAAFQNFAEQFEKFHAIKINITSNLTERFAQNKETIVYRVLIEILNNALKHANATEINISIAKTGNFLTIKYFDNGIGFDTKKEMIKPSGLGLFNIRNRIEAVNGTYFMKSQINKGTEISFQLDI